jgi:hypothetical protein
VVFTGVSAASVYLTHPTVSPQVRWTRAGERVGCRNCSRPSPPAWRPGPCTWPRGAALLDAPASPPRPMCASASCAPAPGVAAGPVHVAAPPSRVHLHLPASVCMLLRVVGTCSPGGRRARARGGAALLGTPPSPRPHVFLRVVGTSTPRRRRRGAATQHPEEEEAARSCYPAPRGGGGGGEELLPSTPRRRRRRGAATS